MANQFDRSIYKQIDLLLRAELESKGTKRFFKDGIVTRVVGFIDFPGKHEEVILDSYKLLVDRRLTNILHREKTAAGLRLYETYRVDGHHVWQHVAGMSLQRLKEIYGAYDMRRMLATNKTVRVAKFLRFAQEIEATDLALAWSLYHGDDNGYARRAV